MSDGVVDNGGAVDTTGDVDVTKANIAGDAGDAGDTGATDGGEAKWFDAMPDDMKELMGKFETREAFEAVLKGPVVPEGDYTFTDEMKNVLNMDAITEYAPKFKELGLSQEKVDAILGMQVEYQNKLFESLAKEHEAAQETELKDYAKSLGQTKFNEQVANAQRAVKAFAGEDGVKWLNETGLNRNPRFIAIFAGVGEKMAEDSAAGGTGGGATKATDTASVLFGDMIKRS